MWDRDGLHAMNDEEKMDENRNEEIGDEEQEEEHQKARAIAIPDIPIRREVEDHNMTCFPFRSCCSHCQRGRGRRSAQKRRHNEGDGMDDRAVTSYSIDHLYLTEEDNAVERKGAGIARGNTTLGRPIIGSWDRKSGCVRAHQVKCEGSGDPWIGTSTAEDIEKLGFGGSRVVLKADQEVAITDVQRQVVAVRWGETVPMTSRVGESQSNGREENAVRIVQVLIRTRKTRWRVG